LQTSAVEIQLPIALVKSQAKAFFARLNQPRCAVGHSVVFSRIAAAANLALANLKDAVRNVAAKFRFNVCLS
jgi:hypothetical protein